MPSTDVGAEVLRNRALNCCPWVRSLTQLPAAVIHSPAEIAAAWPTKVTSSRWPRALSRRTRPRDAEFRLPIWIVRGCSRVGGRRRDDRTQSSPGVDEPKAQLRLRAPWRGSPEAASLRICGGCRFESAEVIDPA